MVNVTRYDLNEDPATGEVFISPVPETMEGRYVAYEDYAALQQKLDAMAADNAGLKQVFVTKEFSTEVTDVFSDTAVLKIDGDEHHCHQWVDNDSDVIRAVLISIKSENPTPATDAYLNSVRAEVISEFCALIDKYGKVEPHHFDPDFADLYAKINKKLYEGILDNPAVYDMESLVDWIERGADDSRAYADMAIIFWNEQLRSGTHDTADEAV